MKYTERQAKNFWTKVDIRSNDECWMWMASVRGNGRGAVCLNHSIHMDAHKVAFELCHGELLEGEKACHTCDVELCCNPAHLYRGDHDSNMKDRCARNRTAKGIRHGRAKLDYERAEKIRNRYSEGDLSQAALAAMEGVSPATISNVVNYKQWSVN